MYLPTYSERIELKLTMRKNFYLTDGEVIIGDVNVDVSSVNALLTHQDGITAHGRSVVILAALKVVFATQGAGLYWRGCHVACHHDEVGQSLGYK